MSNTKSFSTIVTRTLTLAFLAALGVFTVIAGVTSFEIQGLGSKMIAGMFLVMAAGVVYITLDAFEEWKR